MTQASTLPFADAADSGVVSMASRAAELESAKRLQVLDSQDEWSAFSRSVAGQAGVWESSVVIEGMHCAACSFAVEDALRATPGVLSAQVSAASRRAQVVWAEAKVAPSAWVTAVQAAGYNAVPANDTFATERRRLETRRALWRWLVAGLCMMQVMMYAYPAYIAKPGDLTQEMEHLLRWASWVLTLPVMLFSSGPFFSAAWRDIRQARISMDLPVALGIAITFIVSTIGTFEPDGIFGREVFFDSLTMFVFFLLTGRWLELRMRDRTAGALEAVMNRLPDSVDRQLPSGDFERIAARRVQVGDVLRIRAGESFPADGLIVRGDSRVDEALMTGESHPISRGVGDAVLCGSHNLAATVDVRVERIGASTRFAQIVALMDAAATTKPAAAQMADRLARPFLVGVLVAASLACWWWWRTDPGHALMVAVAVLIVTCPCALSLATPAAMLASAGALAKRGVLVRRLQTFETLAKATTVVFDKTGTLTLQGMVLRETRVREGASAQVALQMVAAMARHSLHPVSVAVVDAAALSDGGKDTPWTCDHGQEESGQGLNGVVHGQSPAEYVRLRLGSAQWCGLAGTPSLYVQAHVMDAQGWLATFDFEEALRPDAQEAIRALESQGLTVRLLSGDNPASVNALALKASISLAQGGCSPADKLAALREMQARGECVVMVGDGLNDGPGLAGADVSIAFGQAVPLAQAQADLVVLGGSLLRVAQSVTLARRTVRIVHQNLWWALIYNVACIPLAVVGLLPAWLAGLGMASSSLLVVLNAMRLTASEPLESLH